VLQAPGFTSEVASPFEEEALLALGLGITNLVERATATAADLSPDELRHGACRLEAKVRRYRPRFLGFLGMTAFRTAFRRPRAALGPQPEDIGGSRTWLLPNPSGAQAH
jgi:TDG/mug DNA glycosylase family protein